VISTFGDEVTGRAATFAPGLLRVASAAAAALLVTHLVPRLSSLVVAVVLGAAWTNIVGLHPRHRLGVEFAARTLLRSGVVLLGLRLTLNDLGAIGGPGLAVVVSTVLATFFGTLALGRRLGIKHDLSLLVATGYSICGASAIAAMEPNTDANEEEVAAAIGLVTIFGSLAIVVLPLLSDPLGLHGASFGSWVGASTHDVAQVIAAASAGGSVAVSTAVVVKLTRVALLAPLVAGVSMHRRSTTTSSECQPPLIPRFIIGFMILVLVRSTGVLPPTALDVGRHGESILLTCAMVAIGTGVGASAMRALGFRPLILGAAAWILVGGASYAGVLIINM
jgi:uncharacterized integral membrane protein (TIGR00698 family)